MQIKIGDTLFQRVTATKSLGIMIDETLTWHSNTDLITKKVNRGLHVLKRLRDLVDMGTLVTVYKTLIQPQRLLLTSMGLSWNYPSKPSATITKQSSTYVCMNSGQAIYLKN